MQALFESGRIADLVLIVLILDAIAIFLVNRRTGRGPTLGSALPFLLAGGCLLVAWRTAAAGLPWPLPAAFLAGAGAAHLVDLLRRP